MMVPLSPSYLPWLPAAHRTKSAGLHQCLRPLTARLLPLIFPCPLNLSLLHPISTFCGSAVPQAPELFGFPGPLPRKLFLPHPSIPCSTQIAQLRCLLLEVFPDSSGCVRSPSLLLQPAASLGLSIHPSTVGVLVHSTYSDARRTREQGPGPCADILRGGVGGVS